MNKIILKIWNGEWKYLKCVLYIPLFVLAVIYKAALKLRDLFYEKGILKTTETGVYVISVGNIRLGGTGKTSIVERLAVFLKNNGLNPGIVTRGYKRKKKGTFSVNLKKDRPLDVGDEAFLLAEKTKVPVLVSDKKYEAVWLGIKDFGIDVAIIDDGFQTKNIKKDMEIVVINEDISKKNIDLFPLGPYREPVDALRRANVVLIKKDGQNQIKTTDLPPLDIPKYRFVYKPSYIYNLKHNMIGHYNILKGKKVLAFSGLGDNESFFKMVRSLGCMLIKTISFPDHHIYSLNDLRKISSNKRADFIVTTAKDAIKIADLQIPDNLFYLAVDLEIEKEDELMEYILSRINAHKMLTAYSH